MKKIDSNVGKQQYLRVFGPREIDEFRREVTSLQRKGAGRSESGREAIRRLLQRKPK